MGRKTGLCSTRLARKSSDRGAANDTDRGLQANLQSQAAQGLVGDEPSFRCGGFMERCSGLYAEVSGFFLERCEAIVKRMNHCFSQYRRQAGSKAHLAPVLLRRPVVNPQGSRFLARS